MKIVINKCFGGFNLSNEAVEWMKANGAEDASPYSHCDDFYRDDPVLIACVEALGNKANGDCAELKVVEVPDGVQVEIMEYDGKERVVEVHRTWG